MNVETKRVLEELADEAEADRLIAAMEYDEYYDYIEDAVWYWYAYGDETVPSIISKEPSAYSH